MASKRPPNAEATQFRAGPQQVEIARKGGIARGKRQREKRTVQKILSDYLDTSVHDNSRVSELADKLGLSDGANMKELFVMICIINTLKEGDISDLERLMKLLGEQKEAAGTEEKLDRLLEEFKNAVKSETT